MRNEEEERYIENALAIMDYKALENFTDEELCAFNCAIQTFHRINPKNMSYEKAVQYKLINAEGCAWDLEAVQHAAATAVLKRIKRD